MALTKLGLTTISPAVPACAGAPSSRTCRPPVPAPPPPNPPKKSGGNGGPPPSCTACTPYHGFQTAGQNQPSTNCVLVPC